MNFIDRLRFVLGYKESQARIISSITQTGIPQSTPANYENFAKQGYGKNTLVYVCISKIAKACSGIKWEAYSKRKGGKPVEIENSPLLDLINRPNPMQGTSSFVEAAIGYFLISGNCYIEAVRGSETKPPLELWPVRPDRMKIKPGKNGYPAAYCFSANGQYKEWPVDFIKLKSDILHLKSFNPLNDWYGMSPLEAAMLSLDQNNAANTWNLSLLKNSATPSGVLQMKVSDANPRGELTSEQYERLRAEFYNSYMGAKNAGRPMIIEGGLQWNQVALSPKDMEFIKGKEVTSLDIAMAYGIPAELLGLGQKTFNNYKEARLAFYEETVLPLMDFFRDELNRWLSPAFGEDLYLEYDKDDIEALTYKREQKFATLKDANFLTQNEKREVVGWEPKEGWDVFIIGNQLLEHPDDAQGATDSEVNPDDEDPNKKPNGDEENGSEDEDREQDDGDGDTDEDDERGNGLNADDDEKQWKSVNLVNANEKRKSWRLQNQRRKRLENPFSRDLAQELKELNSDLVTAAKSTTDTRLREFEMSKAIEKNMAVIKRTIEKHVGYTLEDFGLNLLGQGKSIVGVEVKSAQSKFDFFVKEYVKKRSGEAIKEIEGTTRKQVNRIVKRLTEQTIEDGDPNTDFTNELLEEFDSLTPGRARTIARTEVSLASSNGSLEAAKALQVPGMVKEWVSANDSRVRDGDHGGADHSVMNGESVSLDEKFTVPPDASMEGPGDPSASADQVINCRCVLVYSQRGNNG